MGKNRRIEEILGNRAEDPKSGVHRVAGVRRRRFVLPLPPVRQKAAKKVLTEKF